MFNGGSQFWEWFVNQVADKVAIDPNTRVLNDIKKLYEENNHENLFSCDHCKLPTDKQCIVCLDASCGRIYYCQSTKLFTCNECGNCKDCHDKCCICSKEGCFEQVSQDHTIYLCDCGDQHVYCDDHWNDEEMC